MHQAWASDAVADDKDESVDLLCLDPRALTLFLSHKHMKVL